MTKLLARLIEADATGLYYLVDDAGRITPIRRGEYEEMGIKDPRLEQHVCLVRSDAWRVSLEARGLPTGQEVWTN